ncbi:tetratricopeptide repeat protein 6 isoform X2 [Peromyscus eremicus]|uniref:tetratricopeptide repeat protein 6 isoform X2 n=1 Tax=Peromyscus eremicus TaxID=42410 RepID=UPI0027DE6440|nr:tetratricopeptide repeat protein 6 isoform X2 [Peromyscus eremicus]
MSTIPKHFGLTAREESYMFKELEKVRQETKKECYQFKQKLAARLPWRACPEDDFEDQDGEARPCSAGSSGAQRPASLVAKPLSPTPPSKGQSPERPAKADLQGAPQSTRRRGPGKPEPFRPRDFYLRSSAFLRHQSPRAPPAIARQAGTAKPARLLRPRSRHKRRHVRIQGEQVSRRVFPMSPAHEAPGIEVARPRYRQASSLSSLSSETDESGRLRRLRIRTHFLREGMGSARWFRPLSRTGREMSSGQASLQMTRAFPTNIEEIVASLQSEAQMTSDQTIKELIQSILGQNYDLTKEGISLMEQMYFGPSQVPVQTPELEEEKEFQTTTKERPVTQNIYEEVPEAVSSVFQIEQEDLSEWGLLGDENLAFKSQEMLETVLPEDSTMHLEPGPPTAAAKKITKQPSLQVRAPEFLHIRGKELKRIQRSRPVVFKPLKRIKSVRSQPEKKIIKKIPQVHPIPHLHDLCCTVPAVELPVDLHLASRVYHTPDRTGHKTLLRFLRTSVLRGHSVDDQRDRIVYGVPVMSEEQRQIGVSPIPPEDFPELAQTSQWQARQPNLKLSGEEVSAYPGTSRMFWNLAAPKFAIPESTMRATLYPKYESVQSSRILTEKLSASQESVIISDTYPRRSFKSLILKKSASYENIQKYSSAPHTRLKRSKSTAELRKEETPPPFIVKDDIDSNLKHLLYQKKMELDRQIARQKGIFEPSIKGSLETVHESESMKYLSVSLVEESRKAGITYIVYPRKRKKLWKKGLKFQKIALVYEQLSKPPKKLERSTSHGILPGQKKFFIKVPVYERQIRSPSVPMILNFDKFVQSKGGIPENTDPRTWVIEMFSKEKSQKTRAPVIHIQKDIPEPVAELPKLELNDHVKCDLPPEVIKYYEAEVERLTQEIKNEKRNPVFAYCRRGAIYRKLGKLQSAMNDLQETIFVEPLFLNAYWHRHFIYLFQDKINDALDDLNFINKYNKNHAEAYLSKAEIFREKKDYTLAILNYSQAIKCRPRDADLYFKRGELYEKTNSVLAIDDYSKCIFYDPKRTDAWMKRAMHCFENENWIGAIYDFTALLKLEPRNTRARTNRGRAYSKRAFYKQATQDFSVAIHLDPNNWLALYYRACLFRKTNPHRALQDYSVSALINDGYDNLNCFLHRGILYAQLKLWMLAICDFETVISLERTATVAYINIGLIYLLYLDNYTEAFLRFTEAIKVDPLFIQSYICRAEAYHKLHKLKKAVCELSRAIHLQPDGIQLYIIRGQYLLMMKCHDLAKLTIYQVAEMNKGLIELTPIQQALIYSFCENHDKAIHVLEGVIASRPEISTLALLAKAQMKAKKIKESVRIFKKALEMFPASDKGPSAVSVSAECLYNLGLCYMEEGNLQMAFDSLTKAVKANPEFAEAFYHRGLCKVKLNKENSILDFNRAITLNPKHYQAYLCRVAYYGLKGRYSKAILNCNEAIRLYPESVRAYICRGVLKYYNRSYQLAIADLTTAINMDKNSYAAFYNRALCYTKIRELQMALRDYGIVLLLDAGERIALNTFINRGLIYTELKQYGFALEINTTAEFLTNRGVIHEFMGQQQSAIVDYQAAISLDPKYSLAYFNAGNIYLRHRQFSQAMCIFLNVFFRR